MNGVLCIHGFTGSPKELEPLTIFLKDHTDWIIKTPVLPGHENLRQLKETCFMDWIYHAEEELKNLMEQCDKIYLCGFSMGGLIASWLSAHYPVEKLVLLSAAAYYTNPIHFCEDFFETIIDGCRNSFSKSERFQNYKMKFTSTPFKAYLEFRKLVRTVRPVLSKVNLPTFIVQGKRDPIVPEKSAYYLYNKIKTEEKKLRFVEDAKHQICYDDNSNQLFNEILEFLSSSLDCKKIAMTSNKW